jgi:hypothetical protein
MKLKRNNNHKLPTLTPEGCVTPNQPTEADLLRVEIALLHKRLFAQSHAIKQLNHTFRFVLTTLGQPMHIKGTTKSARKGKL